MTRLFFLVEHAATLGDRLTQAMKRRGLKNPDVAAALGVHVVTVSKWRSDRQQPDDAALERLGELLEVSPAWLRYGEAGSRSSPEKAAGLLRESVRGYGLSRPDLSLIPGLNDALLQMPDDVYEIVWPFLGQMERAGIGAEARDRVHALATQIATGHFTPGYPYHSSFSPLADAQDFIELVRRFYARRGVTIAEGSRRVEPSGDPDGMSGTEFVASLKEGKRKPKAG